ncbi:MAG: flagellar hook-length control protein FliK [Marinomonas sp.]
MISDIQSTLNKTSGNQSANTTSSRIPNYTGTIAKLSSEIKLIESLSVIKFQGSEAIHFQGKPAQILHATSAQQPFTIINTGQALDISTIKTAQLNKTDPLQPSLTIPVESQTNKVGNTPQTRINQNTDLTLASRVVYLTVTSTPASMTSTTIPATAMPSNPLAGLPPPPSIAPSPPYHPLSSSQAPQSSGSLTTSLPAQPSNATASVATPQQVTVTDGTSEFPILSQTPLKKGDTLRVLVDASNNMQVLPTKITSTSVSPHVEALKQSLPKQLSLGDMTQLVKQLQTLSESSPSTLPPQTQQALKQLMQNIPNLAALTASPDAMKQAMQTSGVFTETLLVNDSKTLIPADLKLNLTRLKETQDNVSTGRLASIPTEQIANAIERITTNQLRHFSDPNQISTITYPLHIELPIKQGQSLNFVQIAIDKDASTQEQTKQDRRWLVKLKFDFEETGRFDARVSIQANKVGILFAAEDPETVQKLQKNMSALKQQLKDKDIEVERLDAFQTKLEKDTINVTKSQSLIDVRT